MLYIVLIIVLNKVLNIVLVQVCHVHLGPLKIQNCIIADSHICAGGIVGKGPCRVSIYILGKPSNFKTIKISELF